MEKTEMTDFHKAIGQDVLEEPAETLHDVEVGGAEACTARFTGGEGDGTVCEAHETAVGESDPEDSGGEGGEGGVSVVLGLTVDVPGDGPDLRVDVLQQSGLAHVCFEKCAGDGCERFDRDKEVDSGGAPGRAVLGEATARDDRVDAGVVLQLSAPGVQDTGETWEIGPDAARSFGQPFEGRCRRLKHGLVREALRRAEKGTQGLRDGAGEEEVRSGKLFVQVVFQPLLGCMMLTLGTVAVTTGMIDAVLPPTVWALREAMAVVSALARLDGTDDFAV